MIALEKDSFALPSHAENEGISTDLVPTLLSMYDALYARLSENSHGSLFSTKNSLEKHSEDENSNEQIQCNNTRSSYIENSDLFIEEKEDKNERKRKTGVGSPSFSPCVECERKRINGEKSLICQCYSLKSTKENAAGRNTNNVNSLHDILDKRLRAEKGGSNLESEEEENGEPYISGCPSRIFKDRKDFNGNNETIGSPGLGSRVLALRSLEPSSSPNPSSRFRPVSSISSTSSSSSTSSNSLVSQGATTALAYLASAESLLNEDGPSDDTPTTRFRKDRNSLKARREKSLRAGSDDSGVQCHSISLPVPPTLRPRYCDPNLGYMDRVVLEIIETEEVYVRDLKEVIEGYLEYWRKTSNHGISSDIVENLFCNIEEIYDFNRRLLADLEKCGSNPVAVARCFVKHNSGFTIYTDYCTNYPKTVDVLTRMMQKEESVYACRERQLCLSHTLPLGSYLLKPVQRVLKYHLLLGNILKHFEKDQPGHADILNALSTMTGMAHHINDMKRKHEHAVRVQEIQSLLIGWPGNDLTTFGELAAEGTFRIFGCKAVRHVFLFDKMLLLTKKKDENILIYKTHIMCSNLMLIESIPREPLSFHVIPFDCPRLQYTLECRNLEEKREWTQQLKRVIIENFSAAIPAHARQLVMELGQAKPDDGSALDSRGGGRRTTHHAPEYLERRKDRRRASEGVGLNSRLRLRRSSRSRKEKSEKGQRSRSASRSRDVGKENNEKVSPESPNTSHKPKLKLPLWRRRSEPGVVRGHDSIPSTPELTPLPSPNPQVISNRQNVRGNLYNISDDQRLSVPQERKDLSSTPDCEKETEDEKVVEGESLQQVISKLLHHQLQMQQSLLNKQRRNLLRSRKFSSHYETSDTEADDGPSSCPPLPTSLPPSLNERHSSSFEGYDCVTFKNDDTQSEMTSLCSSITSINQATDLSINSGSQSTLDFDMRKPYLNGKIPNYDNLLNVWNSIKSKNLERKNSFDQFNKGEKMSPSLERDHGKAALRRVYSFNEEKQDMFKYDASPSPCFSREKSPSVKEDKERPATIAVYDTASDTFDALENYLNHSLSTKIESKERFPVSKEEEKSYSNGNVCIDEVVNVHPEHKIYSKASVNRRSIKRILSKIATIPKSPLLRYHSDSHNSLYLDRASNRKASNLVSSMARHCSRTIKEKIKQITAEDLEKENVSNSDKNTAKSITSSVGARLAHVTDESDYAVPNMRQYDQEENKSEIRPDSVLSVSSIWTSSSSSSNNSNYSGKQKKIEEENVFDIGEFEKALEESSLVGDEVYGDSFYEKSFEAIESLLENELFRDSAIYSDPEDTDGYVVGHSRKGTLSRESSFRLSTYVKYDEIVTKDSVLITPNNFENNAFNICNHDDETSSIASITSPLSTDSIHSNIDYSNPPSLTSLTSKKVPPPVPAKPKKARGTLIEKQLKNLEECSKFEPNNKCLNIEGLKSLHERRKLLSEGKLYPRDRIASAGESKTREINSNGVLMASGWVKHVVGKLQID